ncbi:MAG TPA: lycopene cyclase domain-containing protein [Accumulibacter sp.]|uniref:lycopene cyclase domain-containing protein n=1 Tax=Accumulibacter sp. TaxID=2053492 RepID=UPI002BB8EF99|nr:lycopene cyclase domain-containing protein [Accumulibacter sp.]HRF73522.1 lycopene cyclase domain-containing protein [Accumulibacter sp.]
MEADETAHRVENDRRHGRWPSGQPYRVPVLLAAMLIVPTALTLSSVEHPGVLNVASDNPTPYGYTWSLLLFIVPVAVLGGWFARRPALHFPRRAFWRTLAVLVPLGFVLDLAFGNAFFVFGNQRATLGVKVPAVGGALPVEEFVFYLSGFMAALLSYVWADEYWMSAYNVPDYRAQAHAIVRLVRPHYPSVWFGIALIAAAATYKRWFSDAPAGFPWYFTYLTLGALVPSVALFHTARSFINWRAFSFTFLLMLLISLLWEVTLAVPYGWWGFRPEAMIGIHIDAWYGLPIEEPLVWMAVSYATVIVYEVIKIWLELGVRAPERFFGAGKG